MVVILLISISGLQWNTDIQWGDCAEYRSLKGKPPKKIFMSQYNYLEKNVAKQG